MFVKFEILVECCVIKLQRVGREFLMSVEIVCKLLRDFNWELKEYFDG